MTLVLLCLQGATMKRMQTLLQNAFQRQATVNGSRRGAESKEALTGWACQGNAVCRSLLTQISSCRFDTWTFPLFFPSPIKGAGYSTQYRKKLQVARSLAISLPGEPSELSHECSRCRARGVCCWLSAMLTDWYGEQAPQCCCAYYSVTFWRATW